MPAISLLPGTFFRRPLTAPRQGNIGVGDWPEVHKGERADEAKGNALPALETPDDKDVEPRDPRELQPLSSKLRGTEPVVKPYSRGSEAVVRKLEANSASLGQGMVQKVV